MASTNPFQHGNAGALGGVNETNSGPRMEGRKARRAAGQQSAGTSRGNRAKQRKEAARAGMDKGFPSWEGLKPVLLFFMAPGLLGVGIAVSGPWPVWILYFFAGLMGLWVFSSAFKGVELVLACFLMYLPFSTTYVIPVAPGVNGTNMLILLGLFSSTMSAMNEKRSMFDWPKGSVVVFMFAFLSCFSAITAMVTLPYGVDHMLHQELLNYKGWVDQFILYFICLSCIRSIDVAKRVVIYMCIGSVVLMIHTIPEMLEKAGRSSIDKSRLGGPHIQPNMFGGFVAYSMLPMVALFVTYIKDFRVWLLTPYFLLTLKVLIGTFSRGAYVAMAAGAFLAAYFKGKGFLIMWATLAVSVLLVFPNLFPEAIKARIGAKADQGRSGASAPKLDKSSETRLILWRAGGAMILESPLLGKGFKGFPKLKGEYTEISVVEQDPHSTYVYIASQMGLPALMLFLMILAYSFHLGRLLSRNKEDLFIRAIGVGGASATVCYAIICIFGSRAVNLEFTAYFWANLACMQAIDLKLNEKVAAGQPKKKRTNAYAARANSSDAVKPATSAELALAEADALEAPKRLLPAPAGQRVRKRGSEAAGLARKKGRRLKQNRGEAG